jgi:hypothetical protein
MINGLAIYPKNGKLYMLHIRSVNGDTGMVYFYKNDVYRIKMVDDKFVAVKVMMTEPPIAFKYKNLPLFGITNNVQAPGMVLNKPEVISWLIANRARYDLNENKIISLKKLIRTIVKECIDFYN